MSSPSPPSRENSLIPTSSAQLLASIKEKYSSLSKQLQLIARYIEQHPQELMMSKIIDISTACEVQPSTVIRFAQRFGFSGFTEMQALFRQDFADNNRRAGRGHHRSSSYQNRIQKLITTQPHRLSPGDLTRQFINACQSGLDHLADTLDDAILEKAVRLLQKADNIYVVGVRRAFPIAEYMIYALQHTSKRVHGINGLGGMHREQIRSIRSNDLLIAISFTPYGAETQYCARVAKQRQAQILAITDSQMSPVAMLGDTVLIVQEGSAFSFRSLTSTISLCQAIFISLAYRLELNISEDKRDAEKME